MPVMDGLTATRQIRATEPPGVRIPIIGLTAGSSPEHLSACRDAGMDAVTTKPITLPRLRAAIAEGCSAAGEAPAAPGPTSRLHQLAEMLGEEAVAEIVHAFSEDTRANLASMQQAAARGDAYMLYRTAHSVAGAARNVGADAMAIRASAMEESVGSMSPARIASELAAMQQEFETALAALAAETLHQTSLPA